MRKHEKELLQAADEAGCFERPSFFDPGALEAAAHGVAARLEIDLGYTVRLEGAKHHQDASFGVAILLVDFEETDSFSRCIPSILCSNFGRLATLTFEDQVPAEDHGSLRRILVGQGFDYISEHSLEATYDGVMAGDPRLPTWRARYFDWL